MSVLEIWRVRKKTFWFQTSPNLCFSSGALVSSHRSVRVQWQVTAPGTGHGAPRNHECKYFSENDSFFRR